MFVSDEQILVVHPSECIHLHCSFTLQLNTLNGKKRDPTSNVNNYSFRVYNVSFLKC